MQIITNIEQRSEEWHNLRRGKITGTSVVKIMTSGIIVKNRLIDEKIAELDGAEIKSFPTTAAMQWGIDHEDEARSQYELIYDTDVLVPAFVISGEYDFIGVSPDGMTDSAMQEIKCPNTDNHHKNVLHSAQVKKYNPQMQLQMWVCEKKVCHFISYDPRYENPNKRIHVIEVKRDDIYIQKMKNLCVEFYDHVMKGTYYQKESIAQTTVAKLF